MNNYSDIFAKHSHDIGQTNVVQHHIETGDEPPVRQRVRRLPMTQTDELKHCDANHISPQSKNRFVR